MTVLVKLACNHTAIDKHVNFCYYVSNNVAWRYLITSIIVLFNSKENRRKIMKNFFGIILCLVLFSAVSTVNAEEYIVRQGDNLTRISELTGHSVCELTQMNNIENSDSIFIGQKITYISEDDIENAGIWCEQQIVLLEKLLRGTGHVNGLFDERELKRELRHYRIVWKGIKAQNFRYSINEPSGIYFDLILIFAEVQRYELSLK